MRTTGNQVARSEVPKAERERGHQFQLRVYYEDTDAGGIVYYANYLKFAERARTEMLRNLGYTHGSLYYRQGLGFVVRRCVVDYRNSARLDETLIVQTLMGKVRRASFDLDQRVFRGALVTASLQVTLAMVDETGRASRLPEALIAALTPQYRVGN